VVTFNESRYSGGPAALAAVWGAMLAGAAALAAFCPRRGERRMLALLAFCLALDLACFSLYYVPFEGVFLCSAQSVGGAFMPMAFLAARISGWPQPRRRAALALGAVLVIALAANNAGAMLEALRLGFGPSTVAG